MNSDNPDKLLDRPNSSTTVIRKKSIDMRRIRTMGKDNIDSAFTGSAHSVLSSLGVKVLDSEEIEKNVIEQAVSLSEQQTPEFNELQVLCTVSLPPASLKTLNRLQLSNNEELAKVMNSTEDGLFLLRTRLRMRQQMLRSAIQKKEEEILQCRLEEMKAKQKREGAEVVVSPKKARTMDTSVEERNTVQLGVIEENVRDKIAESEKAIPELHKGNPMNTKLPQHQDQSTRNQDVSHTSKSDSQEECCPICGVCFSDDTDFVQRSRHVERCLDRRQQPVSKTVSKSVSKPVPKPVSKSVSKPSKLVSMPTSTSDHRQGRLNDDHLTKQEKNRSQPLYRMDVRCTHKKRVLIDDGDSRFYRTLVYQYLLWRQAEREGSEESAMYYERYHELASVVNGWIPTTEIPSPSQVQSAIDEYYEKEPAYLLSSGCLIPCHVYDTLYPYQQEGVRWILKLHQQEVGGILADEMGLGKTIQIVAALIALMFSWEAKCRDRDFESCPRGDEGEMDAQPVALNTYDLSSILVVPATLLGHWMRELHSWCPLLRTVVIHSMSKTVSEGTSLSMILTQCRVKHRYDIVMTTYEGLRSSPLFQKQDWFYAILDEGGKIKNSKVRISQTCRLLRTVHRLLISGTPLQNNLKELWSLFDFVYPGRLGTQEAFVSTFVVPIHKGIYSNASLEQSQLGYQMSLMLQDTIDPYILRRLKRDVKSELPPKTEQVLSCNLTPIQEERYLNYLQSEQVQVSLLGHVMPFKAIVRLRQICNHPVFYQGCHESGSTTIRPQGELVLHKSDGMYVTEEYKKERKNNPTVEKEEDDSWIDYDAVNWRDSCKMIVLNEILHIWSHERHKVLIYTQTVSMLRIIEKYVNEQHFRYCRMDGSTPISKRQALVDMFNTRPNIFLFLLTTRVGGLGLNLVGADRVILFDPDWNPSVDIQARERCWRIGQKHPVTVYRLITSGTIEEKIYHRQIFKTVLSNRVLGEGHDLCSFTSSNLNDLFTYSKRERGTETGEIFPEGEILPNDLPQEGDERSIDLKSDRKAEYHIHDEITDSSDEDEEDLTDNQKVISCLFNKGELKSVFNHDYAFDNTDVITMNRLAREAREEAEELQQQLQESRKEYLDENPLPCMIDGRFSLCNAKQREAKVSSADILQRMKDRQRYGGEVKDSKPVSSTHYAMAKELLHFFQVRKEHCASTDAILDCFAKRVKYDDKYVFRSLLWGFASLKDNIWTLKSEWLLDVY